MNHIIRLTLILLHDLTQERRFLQITYKLIFGSPSYDVMYFLFRLAIFCHVDGLLPFSGSRARHVFILPCLEPMNGSTCFGVIRAFAVNTQHIQTHLEKALSGDICRAARVFLCDFTFIFFITENIFVEKL